MKTRNRGLIYLITGILILAMSACTPSDGGLPDTGDNQQPGSEAGLANTQWSLVSYGQPGSETQVIEGTEVTLQFEAGNQAGGSGSCNTFGAQYEVMDGRLAFTQIISTEIACTIDGVMEQEQQYFQALQTAGEYELTDGQLTIWYGDGQGVLNFVPSVPSAAILLPLAFFLSVLSPDAQEPNALIYLAYLGAVLLVAGVLA